LALILAINPGNSHSPTLARLARELPGCELVGADSCGVAITAINRRVPDLVLLPDRTPRGEAELHARLKAIPGGVLTLKLPPVSSADPVALAREIRTLLTGMGGAPAPAAVPRVASPHILAAARAATKWIHARHAGWAEIAARDLAHQPIAATASATIATSESYTPEVPDRTHVPDAPHEPYQPHDPHDPYDVDDPFAETPSVRWWPRVAAFAVVVGIIAAGAWFWPQIRGGATGTIESSDPPPLATQPVETTAPAPAAVETQPETPVASPGLTSPGTSQAGAPAVVPPATAEPVSGWVAVSAPFDVSITAADQPLQLDERRQAAFAPGKHSLRFQNRALGYDETRTVEVRPAEITRINLRPQTTIAVTSSEPAEVFIDGILAGATPFDGRIPLGSRAVTVRAPGGERQFTIEATTERIQLEVDFSQPPTPQ
jgi:hypothetical protein